MGDDLLIWVRSAWRGWPPAPMTQLRLFVSVPTGSRRYRAGQAPFEHWPISFCSLRVAYLTYQNFLMKGAVITLGMVALGIALWQSLAPKSSPVQRLIWRRGH